MHGFRRSKRGEGGGEEGHFEYVRKRERKGSQRDVVCLGLPIATSYMSPNAGGGGVAWCT